MIAKLQKQLWVFFSTLLLSVSFLNHSYAASKIATVDLDMVTSSWSSFKNSIELLEKYGKDVTDHLTKKNNDLKQEMDKLPAQKNILSQSAFAQAQQNLNKKITNFQEEARLQNEFIERLKTLVLKDFDDVMRVAVGGLAKKQNFEIVLPKQSTIYIDDDTPNLTQGTIDTLNKTSSKKISISSYVSTLKSEIGVKDFYIPKEFRK